MGCTTWVGAGEISVFQQSTQIGSGTHPPFGGYHRLLGCKATTTCSTKLKMSGSVPPLPLMPSSYVKGQFNLLHLRWVFTVRLSALAGWIDVSAVSLLCSHLCVTWGIAFSIIVFYCTMWNAQFPCVCGFLWANVGSPVKVAVLYCFTNQGVLDTCSNYLETYFC